MTGLLLAIFVYVCLGMALTNSTIESLRDSEEYEGFSSTEKILGVILTVLLWPFFLFVAIFK